MLDENFVINTKAKFKKIEQEIETLEKLLRRTQLYHASIAKFPVAEIKEDGKDSVFDDIEALIPTRAYDWAAVDGFVESIRFAKKSGKFSNKAARRTAGIIHIHGDEEQLEKINDKIIEINKLKTELEDDITDSIKTYYERAQFYNTHFHGYLMLSVFRHIPLASEPVQRIAFSWIQRGYSESTIEYENAKSLVERIVKKKFETNPKLDANRLLDHDLERLDSADANKLYLVRPTKLNPRAEIVFKDGSTTTVRASVPILVTCKSPLKRYKELKDYDGKIRETKGTPTSLRTPVIFEYGLYQKDKD